MDMEGCTMEYQDTLCNNCELHSDTKAHCRSHISMSFWPGSRSPCLWRCGGRRHKLGEHLRSFLGNVGPYGEVEGLGVPVFVWSHKFFCGMGYVVLVDSDGVGMLL